MQFRKAENLPKDVERYVEEGKAQGLPENKAWAVAWSRYCVAADTYIFTSMGMQTIGELAKQAVISRVIHSDGAVAGTLRVGVSTHLGQETSSHVVQTGVKPVVRVTTKHGYNLTCTPDHQILALNTEDYSVEWVNAENCGGRYLVLPSRGIYGSQVCLPRRTYATKTHNNVVPFLRPNEMTRTLARVLGYLVSEGSITEEGVEFSNSDPKVVVDYTRCMTALFGESPKIDWHQPNPGNRCTKPCAKVRSRTRWYKEFFTSLGLCPGVAVEKQVPEVILRAPREFIAEFLRAFIEGDGYVGDAKHPNRVDLSTASPILARQLHLLLFNMGVLSSFEQNARGYFNIRVHSESMVQRFVDAVGGGVFKTPTQTAFRLKQRGSEFDCVPAAGITRLHKKIANKFPGSNRVSLARIRANMGLLESYAGGNPVVSNLRDLMGNGYSFDLVTEITDTGEAEVYDLSVPGDESFVANGLIAHNCKYKNPGSPHCQKSPGQYFPGRKAFDSVESVAARVAIRHMAATAVGSKLPTRDRQKINASLIRAGMDGNTRFRSPGMGLAKINEVLQVFGVEWGETINSWALNQPKGKLSIDLASQTSDPFSPVQIENTALSFHWDTLESGVEIIAYLG